jgi:DNA-binding response OmpR family regulator
MADSLVPRDPPRILIIDDDPRIRQLLRATLESAGYSVLEADEGGQGLVMAARERCALAIVDLFMPGKEGLETIVAARRTMPTLKLIAISGGSADGNLLAVAESFGANRTIEKPFELTHLLHLVAELVPTP